MNRIESEQDVLKLIEEGLYPEALKSLNRLSENSTSEKRLKAYLKALTYLYSERFEDCLKVIAEALSKYDAHVSLLALRANAYYALGFYSDWLQSSLLLESEFYQIGRKLSLSSSLCVRGQLTQFFEEIGELDKSKRFSEDCQKDLEQLRSTHETTLAPYRRILQIGKRLQKRSSEKAAKKLEDLLNIIDLDTISVEEKAVKIAQNRAKMTPAQFIDIYLSLAEKTTSTRLKQELLRRFGYLLEGLSRESIRCWMVIAESRINRPHRSKTSPSFSRPKLATTHAHPGRS